jgi:hypothetical protein
LFFTPSKPIFRSCLLINNFEKLASMSSTKKKQITADMTLLDIVSEYPATEAVFKSYDKQVGECICCQMLFEPVQQVTEKYNLDLSEVLGKLNSAFNK